VVGDSAVVSRTAHRFVSLASSAADMAPMMVSSPASALASGGR
jgi:hypothetical protein